MREKTNRLLVLLGTNEAVAEALEYTPRQYRNIRNKILRGEDISPRIMALISLKLSELDNLPEKPAKGRV